MANNDYQLTYLCNICDKYVTPNHLHKFPIPAQISETSLDNRLQLIQKDADGCYVID